MLLDQHLKELFQASDLPDNHVDKEIAQIEQWYSTNLTNLSDHTTKVALDRIESASSLDQSSTLTKLLHLQNITGDELSTHEQTEDIIRHPLFISNKNKLINILTSNGSDGEISGEIAEILGYAELELATSIVQQRRSIIANATSGAVHSKPAKRKGKGAHDLNDLSSHAAKRRMAESLHAATERPLWSGTAQPEQEVLPHVYTSSSMTQSHAFSSFGAKYLLPIGTTREYFEDYEEVTVPPARTVPPRAHEKLIPCSELPPLASSSFPGYKTLNRIQSIVYPTAFTTNENMLICAPTGAGKTDVAMLTVLRVIEQHRRADAADIPSSIRHNDFKIIYVAPMKALAAEIVRKLGKRLAWLRIKVRELTGDMQLTKAEIAETQIIVTTPEKWDVVTRKPTGEGELAAKVKLLIIDEVHLLNDERGAVIETIVARTVRQVESTQSLIRIVGLSATLPNYVDVADFLRVSRQHGLFYFDSSFRPVPLEQHFLGVKGKAGSPAAKRALDKTAYRQVSDLVRDGHQVMVFVHSRKDTVKSAESLKELATQDGDLEIFSCQENPQFEFYRRDIGRSKNKEMKQLFDLGFGIHHAGMLRTDRNLMEKLFDAKAIKVLCCTATLAWGVNLPAHGVIIKGTQLYDPSQGKFIDLSVLDVLQIFGRAGRPGMETSGVGYICTPEDKLQHYLEAVTAQHPIESKFAHGLLDSLNAEIALGTVTNVSEGAEWLSYTYLFVRMRKNPMVYGMTHDDPVNDPDLTERRHLMITLAGRKLAAAGMVQYNEGKGTFSITDVGRIAAKYYVRHASIEVFQQNFKSKMTEADVLSLLAMSTEFDQIQVRENEVEELKALEEEVPCQVRGGTDTGSGKVNVLLQAYISRRYVEDFALVSDTHYAAQNGGRIVRALLEIALCKKLASPSVVLMSISKSIEKKMWGYEHPLAQFDLSVDVLYNLERWADEMEISELASKTAAELGTLIHLNERHGAALLRAAKQFPRVHLSSRLRPLSHSLLHIQIRAKRAFEWSNKIHGNAEPFWFWIEDDSGINILQLTRTSFTHGFDTLNIDFIIPVARESPPSHIVVRAISDRWIGSEDEMIVSFDNLVIPAPPSRHSSLLDLPLLRTNIQILDAKSKQIFSRFTQFNSVQSQCFWPIYNSEKNIAISASSSAGKSVLGLLAVCRSIFRIEGSHWALVLVPRLDNARTLAHYLRDALKSPVGFVSRPREIETARTRIWVTTPECLLGLLSSNSLGSALSSLRLAVCEDLELLDDNYEVAISLLLASTRQNTPRIVGFSSSLSDLEGLSDWLDIPLEGTYCFPPTERDQALSVTFQPFAIPYSTALMKAMAKPVYDLLKSIMKGESAIVFVPSAGQCLSVVSDLVTQCALGMSMKGFLGEDVSQDVLEIYTERLKNRDMVDGIMRGMGMWHDRMDASDKVLVMRLFVEGIIRVLVIPREACWDAPVRAGLVIVMGTQYALRIQPEGNQGAHQTAERRIVDYTMHEVVRMQGKAVRHGRTGRFHILCQAEQRDGYMRFLSEGLPLESCLLKDEQGDGGSFSVSEVLIKSVKEQRKTGTIKEHQDVLDFLTYTLLTRRIEKNPTYYDVQSDSTSYLSRLVDAIWEQSSPT